MIFPYISPWGPPLPAGHHLSIWGQKWRRFGAALYGGSGCALARLELQEGSEKSRRGEAPRRVIRLNDCLRVSEASGEASSPRDTSTFFLETTERLYLLAAPTAQGPLAPGTQQAAHTGPRDWTSSGPGRVSLANPRGLLCPRTVSPGPALQTPTAQHGDRGA